MTQAIACINNATENTELLQSDKGIRPQVDIYKSTEGYTFWIELPGVPEGHIQIEVDEDNILSLTAKNAFEAEGENRVHQFEVRDYHRSFRLGKEVDKEKIVTEFSQGLLKLFIPLREELKPKKISIQI